ncbi:MAG TPA: hypothetical protein VGO00_04775 [Kofleriaceae bacterium]|jgi:hypothetical protein|nr:hypothetical protein [Kofleriaceae bacterium]
MADADTWTILPHGPIQQIEPNLWRVEGTLPHMALKRVMVIAALSTGALVLYSPIALDEAEMTALDALGPVGFIVVPNGMHRFDARRYASRYPNARALGPAGARDKIAKVVEVAELSALPSDPSVSLSEIAGTRGREAMMTVLSAGRRSIVVADAIFNMPHLSGAHGFVLRHVTGSSGGPRVSRFAKLILIKDKRAFAAQLDQLATPDLVRVIVGHHEMITDKPADTLRDIAATLR